MHPDQGRQRDNRDKAELVARMRATANEINVEADRIEAESPVQPESAREKARRLHGWGVIGGIAAIFGGSWLARLLRQYALPVTVAAAGGAAVAFAITPAIDRPRPRTTAPPAALPAPPPTQEPIPTPTPNPTPTAGSIPVPGLGPTIPTGVPTLPTEPIPTPPLTPPVDVTPTPEPPIDGQEPAEPMADTCLVDWRILGLDLPRLLCRELPPTPDVPAPDVPPQGRTRVPATSQPAESSPPAEPTPSWTEAPPTSSPT